MANDAKKISDLTQATTLASTDRVVVLYNATTTANVQTITVSNLFQNIPAVTTTSVAVGTIGTANGFLANATSIMVGNSSSNTQIQWNPTDLSLVEFGSNQNTFIEGVLWNANTGNNASADFIVNDTGGPSQSNPNYIDVGINGSGFLQSSWTISGPSDAYVYSGGTNLSVGTAAVTPYMNFFTGGTLAANERMRITNTGNVGIGTTTPAYKLDVNGDARASASLLVGTTFVANTTTIFSGSSVAGANAFIANSTQISLGNSTVNTFSNSSHFFSGNSTVYGVGNNTAESLVSTSGNLVMTAINIILSNTTGAVITANLTGITTGAAANVNITNNTGLYLGTSTAAANGYTYLPNGFKMNWGWVSANSTAGNATFVSAYTTNAWSVTATSNSTVATYQAAVIGTNNTVVQIRTANVTSTNVFFIAIGT